MSYQFTELSESDYANFEKQSEAGSFLQSIEQAHLLKKEAIQYGYWALKKTKELLQLH